MSKQPCGQLQDLLFGRTKGGRMKRQTATVECPKSMVGRVIGKNGETIKALQSYTGALIQIDQTVEPTKVTISGTAHSLSLAVSMVTDIVKGTFKGFALLRQVTTPGVRPIPIPQPLNQPRPVYAPGYGLIPPSQLYGAEDRPSGAPAYAIDRSSEQLQQSLAWTNAQLAPSQVVLGSPTLLPSHLQQVPVQQGITNVYGVAAPYGTALYAYPPDYGQGHYSTEGGSLQPSEAYVLQDAGMFSNPSTIAGETIRVGTGAKLLQTAASKASRPVNWGPKVPSGANMSDLLAQAGSGVPSTNLVQVVDSDGKIYYYNPDG